MRNKYGKLFIEIEEISSGNYQVKEEYRQPLLNYISGKQYKDVIIKLNNSFYPCIGQYFGDNGGNIDCYDVSYYEGEINSFTAISISVSNNVIQVTINEL